MNSKEKQHEKTTLIEKVSDKLMLYTPLVGGMPIAATEMRREGSNIIVEFPGHVAMNQRQTGYVFNPPQFTSRRVTLHEGALVMSCELPPAIKVDYIRWRDDQEEPPQ